ncbi:glycoside hydrolase family 3 protein [Dictyobacter aurantiacus]|uniref:Beta-N-acetylhexosaminidase n=1 Tax=Dictyobacter aurantiacus TaxID=1936993 RepID=A0A401ZEK3_9CHLR|nr:glycoside hydrolase family 3 protein [Dictyobacter aurantiacus]GCE05253.1 beta-N-acetylhexosaminidase [Dictyobacter aurantiacus]
MQQYLTEGLTLEEQIGQLFVAGLPGLTVTPEIKELIQRYHVGGIVLFKRNLQDIQQIQELTQSLQQIAREAGHRYPLLISIDQENGMVRRFGDSTTIFPGNMTLGAIDAPDLTREIAQATGREMKALGINMNLAPVADVNNNPANPVIGTRSFGEDPQRVARHVAAMVEGYRDTGVITSLKHFPGHGDTAIDSHLALPSLPYTLERLENLELIPFQAGIKAGADSIMIGHLYLPALMPANGMLPATVSPAIVRELLRHKLGYQGLIITDCMEMNAVAETIGVERGAVMALQAGNDLILISHQYTRQKGGIEATMQALETGEITPQAIQESCERVLRLKARMLSWDTLPTKDQLTIIGQPDHLALRDRAYALSTTIVRDTPQLLPLALAPEQHLLVTILQPSSYTFAADKTQATESFVSELRQRHANIESVVVTAENATESMRGIDQRVSDFAMIIVVTVNANLDHYQGEFVRHVLQYGKPTIGLAVYNPYDLLAMPQLGTYLVTYECTPPALRAAASVLFGEVAAQGKLPVSIPGIYSLSS